jgi:hypothetical protein
LLAGVKPLAVNSAQGLKGMEKLGYKLVPVPIKTSVNRTRTSSSSVNKAIADDSSSRHQIYGKSAVHSADSSSSSFPVDQLPLLTGFALLSPVLMSAPQGFKGLAWPDNSTDALQPLQLMAIDIWLPPNVTALALFAAGDTSTATNSTLAATVHTVAGSGPLHCYPSITVEGFTSYQDWDAGGTKMTQIAPSCPRRVDQGNNSGGANDTIPGSADSTGNGTNSNNSNSSSNSTDTVVGAFYGFAVADAYLDEIILVRVHLPVYETVTGAEDFLFNAAIISSLFVSYSEVASE